MDSLRKHLFLLVGLAALIYFSSIELENRTPNLIDVVLFAVGIVSMAIYVVQSFRRVRRTMRSRGKEA